jgi:7-carboxy-7-deazaguanine synthase (Cx14CxxC type)
MTYRVKEAFLTLQGEGINAGRAAVFCRFSGCNLWSGHERNRSTAICQFCDTDFVGIDGEGGGAFVSADLLANHIESLWLGGEAHRLVVFTGGEPLLQLDPALLDAVHSKGFETAIETNGTKPVPAGVDWVCVSPKAGAPVVVESGDELKLVYPQAGLDPEDLDHLNFKHRLLQSMDGPNRDQNTALAVSYCLTNPLWRLSLQTHKYLGIP